MDIDGVREFFSGDRYLMLTGVVIEEAGDGRAVCAVDIVPDRHFNKGGVVQGGVTYTLADSAFAVAANYGHLERGEIDRFITVSQSGNITYFRPPKGERLICTAEAISRGRISSVYRMEVIDDQGTEVALMIGNGYTIDLGN
ncbi:MAG: PaaI family thioesterase [Clostridiales Family XIII bacterium]|jgi:acyl-CoA thioesterase|nr:PaaI family thioesterase [Clostridiales Family XIII bacterium]